MIIAFGVNCIVFRLAHDLQSCGIVGQSSVYLFGNGSHHTRTQPKENLTSSLRQGREKWRSKSAAETGHLIATCNAENLF